MRKSGEHMQSLEVILERLPKAVIEALEGPSVKQDFASFQSMPALDMKTLAMLLRRKIQAPVPLLEVVLERLPESVMSALISKKNDCAMMPLSDIITPKETLLPLKASDGKLASSKMQFKETLPSLKVSLERIPEDKMNTLLAQRKSMLMAGKEKKKVGQLKKIGRTQKCNIPKAMHLI